MSSTVPSEIVVQADCVYRVDIVAPDPGLGQVLFDERRILLNPILPDECKHAVLFHELIHLADEMARASGDYTDELTEEQVIGMTGALWPILVQSGLWNGCDAESLAVVQDWDANSNPYQTSQ